MAANPSNRRARQEAHIAAMRERNQPRKSHARFDAHEEWNQEFNIKPPKASLVELTTAHAFTSDDAQDQLLELEQGTDPSLPIVGRLRKPALLRMESERAAFLAGYLPRFEYEANNSSDQDEELLIDLLVQESLWVGRECMAVCHSPEEFERELPGEIALFEQYCLAQYEGLPDHMWDMLRTGFYQFMEFHPYVYESDPPSKWKISAITRVLLQAFWKLRAEGRKYAAEGGFLRTVKPLATEQG